MFTKEVLREMFNEVDNASLARKKEMASIFGLSTKKADDIRIAIAVALRDIRKNATSFDNNDFADFRHVFKNGIPSVARFLTPFLAEENFEFVKFLLARYEERLKAKDLLKWVRYSNARGMRFSYAERDLMNIYNCLSEFVTNNNPDTANERDAKEIAFNNLVEKFTNLLSDFKVFYIGIVEDRARKFYEHNVEILPSLLFKYNKLEEEASTKKFETQKERWSFNEKVSKVYSEYRKCKAFLKMYDNVESYVASERERGEKDFASNVRNLSDRVLEWNLDIEKITVSRVGLDPKIFEMHIFDGNITLYARSIFTYGAVLVTPHFRFIITKR